MEIKQLGELRIGVHILGNGTKYTAVAIPWNSSESFGCLGRVETGWLVVSGLTGKAYLFQQTGYLADSYIREKLGGHPDDYPYFGDLIRKLIGRSVP